MKKQKIVFAFTIICCTIITGCHIIIPKENNNNWENIKFNNVEIENEQNENVQAKNTAEINYIEYQNKKYDFNIKIPNTRTFQENIDWFDIEIKTPKNDSINENLWIVVQELQTEETLESYTEKTIKWLKELYKNYNEITKEDIEIDFNKWTVLTYEISEDWYKIKAQQIVFLKNNKSYIFQYTATKDTFDKYINEINNIVNSFTLLN